MFTLLFHLKFTYHNIRVISITNNKLFKEALFHFYYEIFVNFLHNIRFMEKHIFLKFAISKKIQLMSKLLRYYNITITIKICVITTWCLLLLTMIYIQEISIYCNYNISNKL
jgi:hypothetical protein